MVPACINVLASWAAFSLEIFYGSQRTCFQYAGSEQFVGIRKILWYERTLLFFFFSLQAGDFFFYSSLL